VQRRRSPNAEDSDPRPQVRDPKILLDTVGLDRAPRGVAVGRKPRFWEESAVDLLPARMREYRDETTVNEPPDLLSPRTTRREFVRSSAAAAVAVGLWLVPSCAGGVSGRAGKKSLPTDGLRVLTADEAAAYDAWCDRLAPGAAEAGVSRYLDAQLAAPRDEAFLFLRVLANPPFEDFYRHGIAGIEQETRARFGGDASYTTLEGAQQRELIDAAAAEKTVAWKSPSPSLFFFVSRGDAVDVAYGTEAGFRRLRVPYIAHIRPPMPW
jgi:Gluconate 2-dehydrogenase subunit 3